MRLKVGPGYGVIRGDGIRFCYLPVFRHKGGESTRFKAPREALRVRHVVEVWVLRSGAGASRLQSFRATRDSR